MGLGDSLFFGFGEQGYNPHQFVMNEIEEDITLTPMDETFTIHLDNKTKVSMYTDRQRFRNELCACFPEQANSIKQLLEEFESFYHQSLDSYGGKFLFTPGDYILSSSNIIEKETPDLSFIKLKSLMEGEKISFKLIELHEAEQLYKELLKNISEIVENIKEIN